jgi:hypothetical protein
MLKILDAARIVGLGGDSIAKHIGREGDVSALDVLLAGNAFDREDGWGRAIRFYVREDGCLILVSRGSDFKVGGTPGTLAGDLDYRRDISFRDCGSGPETLTSFRYAILPEDVPE